MRGRWGTHAAGAGRAKENPMASRPFAFGVRLRDRDRTVRVTRSAKSRSSYAIEDSRQGKSTRRREHASLGDALRDLASTWRGRLH